MVHGNTEHYSTWDRQAGYERAMRDGGFAPEVVTHSDRWEQAERYPTIRSVVERPKSLRPTAVVCYSDTDALNFWSAALATGLRVPEDLSIVAPLTVTPFLEGKYLSGMELNFHEVGAGAVRMLLQKMENPHIKLAPRTVPLGPLTGDTHTVPNH
jgi:LacI family transcriptional regulator